MKKKIIVPIDFSTNSHNAYLYARDLAKDLDYDLELIHAYTVFGKSNPVDITITEEERMEAIQDNLDIFADFYPRMDGESNVNVNTRIVKGHVVSVMVEESKDEDVFMVVLGAKGKYNGLEYLLGSISSKISQEANCPVLLVPSNVKYTSFDNILYSSNFESAAPEMVKKITELGRVFKSALHFIHVNEKNEAEDFLVTEDQLFEQLFEKGPANFSINMASVNANSVEEGLNKYAEENNIDLVVLVNKHRGYWNSLLGRSVSRKMAFSIKNPLLIYHFN